MSKDGSNKHPVSENKIERFMGLVLVLAQDYGIDDTEIYHYVELMRDATARHMFEKNHKVSPRKKVEDDKKRFIAIFKTKYQELMDLEYTKKVTPMEVKLIRQANKFIMNESFTNDEFLAWVFDEFLIENENFRPPAMKSICSQFILHTFIDSNKEKRESRKRQELDKKAGLDLIQRARGLLRSNMIPADEKKVGDILKGYGERRIMLSELRKVVEKLEATYRQK